MHLGDIQARSTSLHFRLLFQDDPAAPLIGLISTTNRIDPQMPHARSRLPNHEIKLAALEAARTILIEDGPQAVTLKAVAARINRTHANLLHHFGSAEGLRKEMAALIAERITSEIGAAVIRVRLGHGDISEVVDMTFDAFEKQGAAALVSWMILSGDHAALAPMLEAVHKLVVELGEHRGAPLRQITLSIFIAALGDGLIGTQIAAALELPRDAARVTLTEQIKFLRGW